jgi:hypothetical protein
MEKWTFTLIILFAATMAGEIPSATAGSKVVPAAAPKENKVVPPRAPTTNQSEVFSVPTASTHLLASPTTTPTQIPEIQAGLKNYARPYDLKAAIHTLKADKRIALCLNGTEKSFERWRLIYREPNDCLLEMFDSQGKLGLQKHFIETKTIIDAGKVHKEISDSVPRAWDKVIEFLDLTTIDPKEIKDSREILPGIWIPNSFERKFCNLEGTKGSFKISRNYSILTISINANVDADFSVRGH